MLPPSDSAPCPAGDTTIVPNQAILRWERASRSRPQAPPTSPRSNPMTNETTAHLRVVLRLETVPIFYQGPDAVWRAPLCTPLPRCRMWCNVAGHSRSRITSPESVPPQCAHCPCSRLVSRPRLGHPRPTARHYARILDEQPCTSRAGSVRGRLRTKKAMDTDPC
ncbi:hypothetical protein K505DRAFT_83772 [Melanomma pulvis-pyrius CBS 109.77]|uniref:Uncharacterized protein n=1 Tax=Melanomma pulvis-pyrius CBS 109.77 TaxID=1314802 RepID=A0A6A6X2P6_9PLEO|nr:hypothetical protein K505DRAFT_83772 [Melanomma pulvis-pyrius CBS 109.77]